MRLAKRARMVGIIAAGFRPYFEDGGVPADRIMRLRNWTRRVAPSVPRAEMRRRFGWAEDEFICVHGGNMGHKQGLDNLLDTADLLRDTGIRIALVGDGNDRERLERIARERDLRAVQFVPLQGPGDWEATMDASDVLLVNQRPSVADMSLPSKLTSYFASGKPVIAAVSSDSETAAEIASADAGIIVPPVDAPALRDAILQLKRDPLRAETLGARGQGYADTTLSRAQALSGYDDFIARLLEPV
jgi:glycosyltransferase involved in cell wall biosynthesis